jgi:hypothetical protein
MGGLVSFLALRILIELQYFIFIKMSQHKHYMKYLNLQEYFDQEDKLFHSFCKSEGFPVMEDYYCHMNKIINKKLHGTKKLQNTLNTIIRNMIKSAYILQKYKETADKGKENEYFKNSIITIIRMSYELHFFIEIYKKSDYELKKYIFGKKLSNKFLHKLRSCYNINT